MGVEPYECVWMNILKITVQYLRSKVLIANKIGGVLVV